MTREATVERLYELQRAAEIADNAWFEALRDGGDGKAEKDATRAAKAAFREFEADLMAAGFRTTCGRCGGEGAVGWGNVFFTTARGAERTCFACHGARTMPLRKHRFDREAPTRLKAVREYEAEQAEKAAEADAKWAAFAADEPEVAAFLAGHVRPEDYYSEEEYDDFLCSMRESAVKWGRLTEKQMAAVKRNMAKVEAERAARDFPRGTVEVEGEIVSLPETRGYAGGTKLNMLVALNGDYLGNRVMGTIPEKVWRAMEGERDEHGYSTTRGHLVGSRVRFTASFTRSDRDDHFGFFKSPKGVEVTHVNTGDEEGE